VNEGDDVQYVLYQVLAIRTLLFVSCLATRTLIHFDVSIYPKNIQVRVTGYYYQYIASNDLLTSVLLSIVKTCNIQRSTSCTSLHYSIIPTSERQ
jgi:hypothetical protein